MYNKSNSSVISAHEGSAYWQPGVQGNCITIKISPWNIVHTNHTVFLHELPKGGEVPEHSHEDNEEIFICLEGAGILAIDGVENTFKQHDVALLAPLIKHSIRATSDCGLKFMVIISPTGLEERLKQMGCLKKFPNEPAPEAFTSELGKGSSHGVI